MFVIRFNADVLFTRTVLFKWVVEFGTVSDVVYAACVMIVSVTIPYRLLKHGQIVIKGGFVCSCCDRAPTADGFPPLDLWDKLCLFQLEGRDKGKMVTFREDNVHVHIYEGVDIGNARLHAHGEVVTALRLASCYACGGYARGVKLIKR